MKSITVILAFNIITILSFGQTKSDGILGKWISEKRDLIVEVYKQHNEYRAKSVWFNTKTKPMELWTDAKNPDPKLRSRKLLGMDVLKQLRYDPFHNEWVDGSIYDATTGKTWQSVVWLDNKNKLEVKGYWLMRFLSKTMSFTRM